MIRFKYLAAITLLSAGGALAISMANPQEEMAMPTEHHALMQQTAGRWAGTAKMYMEPDAEPVEMECTELVENFGAFWILSSFEGSMMGAPFQGRFQMGYDEKKGKYVSTWIDTSNSYLSIEEGTWDEANDVLRMEGEGPSMFGENVKKWSEGNMKGDVRKSKFYAEMPDGSAFMWLEVELKRVADGKPVDAGSTDR